MKKSRKIFSVILALALVLAMSIPAFATEGATGTIKIENAISEKSYTIYKMLTFTPIAEGESYGVYTIETGWENFFNSAPATDYFSIRDGKVSLKEGVTAVSADLAAAAVKYAVDNNISSTAAKTADSATVTFDELGLGYYAVDSSAGAICSLSNTNSSQTIIEKNSGPALIKKIVENNELVDSNTAAIGDTVNYQVAFTVGEGTNKYVIHDEMADGLTFKGDVVVTVNGTVVDASNYTVSEEATDDCSFEIVFADSYITSIEVNTFVVVNYTATLDSDAVIGSEGNPNTAWLTYNTGETEDDETVEDTVITYTTKFTVNKVDGDEAPLTGAGFTLYKDGAVVGSELKGSDMTEFVWEGLDEGTYTIVETTVPAGYNKADDIVFTISCEVPETVTSVTDTAVWSTTSENVKVENGVLQAVIMNTTDSLLPETGGIGTTIFYILGAILVIGAAVLLITKKRMSAEV